MVNIVLIGAGQIGCRHLQALASLPTAASLWVVDPLVESLRAARARWAEAGGHSRVAFVTHVEGICPSPEVVIVATNSDVRRQAVEAVLSVSSPAFFILEKVLFQRPEDFNAVASRLAAAGARAWVNCPRRMWPVYHQIRARTTAPIEMRVSGANWGLACNAIHFLDLFAFLTGVSSVSLANGLDPGHYESKRPGFREVTGTIRADFGTAGRATLTSLADGGGGLVVEATGLGHTWRIDEASAGQTLLNSLDGSTKEERFDVLYQSQLTHRVVEQLLAEGTCALTSFEESARLHIPLLSLLSTHLHGPGQVNACPIT